MNLLIVDDDPTSLKLLRTQLESEGHALFEAHDGVEALVLLNRQRVDAVISDILMPRMDGYRLCHEIRMNERLHDLPIILHTSSFISPDDEKLALDMGADKYLKKPCSLETLVAALREVILQPHVVPRAEALGEVEVLKEYSERLVNKLEKKSTELLAQTEALRLPNAAMTAAANAIMITGRDGSIVWANPAFSTLTDYTLAETIGKNPRDLVKSGQQERAVYEEMWATILAGRIWHGQIVNRRKDGSTYPEEQTITPVRDANGKITHFIAIKQDLSELMAAEGKFRSLVEQSIVGIYIVQDDQIVYINPKITEIFGWSEKEMTSRTVYDFIVPEDHALVRENMRNRISGAVASSHYYLRMLHQSGSVLQIEIHASRMDHNGRPAMMGTLLDITERKVAEVKIRHLNRVLAMQSGISALIVRVRDCDELFREACRIAVEAGAFGMAWIGMIAPDTPMVRIAASFGDCADEYLHGIEISTDTDTPLGQGPIGTAIRENRPVWTQDFQHNPLTAPWHERSACFGWDSSASLPLHRNGIPIGALGLYAGEAGAFDDEEMRLLVELAGDLSFAIDHIEKDKKLKYLAYYDVLTGLANRTLFLDRVAQYIRSAVSGGYKLAVFLLDLERFKNINDSLGRPAGDELLRQVAEWLTREAGDANLLARLGADHFAVVMPEVKQGGDMALFVEKWMQALLDHPFRLNTATFRITAKVGIALFPDDGVNADTLFKNAEAALKQAKTSRNRYLFHTQKMTEMVADKLALENQLRQALDNEEFMLHYQPKVNLVSGKLTSAEALIRWNDPRTGLVPPGRFIPILEETGLIYEVGRWALGKAIEDYLRWRSAGLSAVRIAVNVSALQLRNRGFIAEIEQAIGIDAHAAAGLELEITESLIMEDIEQSIATLRAIRAMGVSIALDDFGTGFSSLSYLSKLPIDTLKIDRSFVIDMTTTPEGLARVSTIINLAHSLKLKVVAEGVETEEQSRLLRLLSCDEMQGFLFSIPVPSDIFETRFLAPPPSLFPPGDE
jgi:diguanylate cyclase (GGDEF)-like protein/PAS domain S-box-containing protein